MLLEPSTNSYPMVRFELLVRWVAEDLGDAALAQEIQAIVESDRSYIDRCLAVNEASRQRLETLRQIAENEG